MREGGLRRNVMLCGRGLRTSHMHRPFTTYISWCKDSANRTKNQILFEFFEMQPIFDEVKVKNFLPIYQLFPQLFFKTASSMTGVPTKFLLKYLQHPEIIFIFANEKQTRYDETTIHNIFAHHSYEHSRNKGIRL